MSARSFPNSTDVFFPRRGYRVRLALRLVLWTAEGANILFDYGLSLGQRDQELV